MYIWNNREALEELRQMGVCVGVQALSPQVAHARLYNYAMSKAEAKPELSARINWLVTCTGLSIELLTSEREIELGWAE